jgi:mannosyltransferase
MPLILDNIIFDLQKAGGISKVWSKHIEQLSGLNIKCNYIETPRANENLFRKEISLPLGSIIMQRPIFPKISRYLNSNCNSINGNGNVFHSSYFRNPNKNMAVIHTVHDFMYEYFDRGFQKKIHVAQKVSAMKRADVIVCVSEHTKRDMFKLYPWTRNKKVYVVYNGVDSEFYEISDKGDSVAVAGYTFKKDSYLLYVGSRGYCKNFPFVLKLLSSEYSKSIGLKLVCVGGGFSERERKQLVELGLWDSIIVFNSLDSSSLNLLYNYAKALLMPSIYEGFGIPALEAAKTGCLVLGANNTTLPEILGPNDFLFSPFDFAEAYLSLNKLDDIEYVNVVKKSTKKKSTAFSWEKMTSSYMTIYKKMGL